MIKNLIDNAEKIREQVKDDGKSKKVIKIARFEELGFDDCNVILEKPSTATILAAGEKNNEFYILSEIMIEPNLADKELQKAFGVNNKIALLKKIFTTEELTDLVMHVGELVQAKNKARLVDDLKN